MKTIAEALASYVKKGFTTPQAENYVCQRIVLTKISKSSLSQKVLIKGGVVMFNRTGNLRRATADLDFDFLRYDISDESIRSFVSQLNEVDRQFHLDLTSIEPLHQEDYRGKRVIVSIKDETANLDFKMDIGVHTLLGVKQDVVCFSFLDEEDGILLSANPPEQIFAEKAYSLAKHGVFSGRSKDLFDMYYLISECHLNRETVKTCLDLLTFENKRGIGSIDEVRESVELALDDPAFQRRLLRAREKWVEVSVEAMTKAIIDFLYDL